MSPFVSLSAPLQKAADCALTYCRGHYGSKGLKIEEGISVSISWRPTFYLKSSQLELLAVEVNDVIFPEAMKGAAHDIQQYQGLIRVIQVCPLEAFQSDPGQRKVSAMRNQGFGLITVSQEGVAVEQFPGVPLQQFVSEEVLERMIKDAPSALKVRLRTAYKTYLSSPIKGVQDLGEIVEALIKSMAKQRATVDGFTAAILRGPVAELIDKLYETAFFKDHRAALGGSRSFIKHFRNPSSHSPRTKKEASDRAQIARDGFNNGTTQIIQLVKSMRVLGLKANFY